MEQLLHTPEGVRDIYHEECAKKLALQNRLHKTLHLYGYHDIQTPMYEYFDVFRKEIGTIPSRELYKFFDRDGNTLVLRPDITPQIHVRRRLYLRMMSSRQGFAMWGIHLSIIPVIRDD